MKDKIIQITSGTDNPANEIFGLSKSGKLYILVDNEKGIPCWDFFCDSPKNPTKGGESKC